MQLVTATTENDSMQRQIEKFDEMTALKIRTWRKAAEERKMLEKQFTFFAVEHAAGVDNHNDAGTHVKSVSPSLLAPSRH